MANQKTEITVRFLHFAGTEAEWQKGLALSSTNGWDDAVVFGYIYNDTRKNVIAKRIYAGKDTGKKVEGGFLYDIRESSGVGSKIVANYEEAVKYAKEEGKQGQIIITEDNFEQYVIIDNAGTLKLLRCKWLYAADTSISGDNWHVASDVITNPMGMIVENTTLGEFVEQTEGEFSRMIEMLLFTNPKPTVKLTVLPDSETEDEYTQIAINVATTNAETTKISVYENKSKEVQIIEDVEDGKLIIKNLKSNTTYRIYAEATNTYYTEPATDSVDTETSKYPDAKVTKLASSNIKHNSAVLTVDSSNASTATLYNETSGEPIEIDFVNREASAAVEGLNAGKTYVFTATATNSHADDSSSKDVSTIKVTTIPFIEPSVGLTATSAQIEKTNSLHIDSAAINITKEGEYVVIESNTYTLKGENITVTGDLDTIKVVDISYGKTYTLYTTYDASLNTTYVEGDVSKYTKEVSATIYQEVPDNASVKITKLNGEEVPTETPTLTSNNVSINFDASARINTAKAYVVYNNGTKDVSTIIIDIDGSQTNILAEFNCIEAAENNQSITVTLVDEYGTKSTQIEFTYTKESLFLISKISDTASEDILFTSLEGSEEDENFTSKDIAMKYSDRQNNPENFFKVANDPKWPNVDYANEDDKTWYPEGVLCQNNTRFFIRNKDEEFSNIKESTTTYISGSDTYYGYYPAEDNDACTIFCLIPTTYTLEFWSDNSGVPYQKLNYIKDDNVAIYDNAEYSIYYTIKDNGNWDKYTTGKLTWILIK